MTDTVDITGLDKGAVLAALFNASAPQGMGFLQAGNGPQTMTAEQGAELLKQGTYFDYVYGRPLKVKLDGDEFGSWGFDRDNGGEGSAQKVIDRLRETSQVSGDESRATHDTLMAEKATVAAEHMLPAEFVKVAVNALGKMADLEDAGIPVAPEGMTPREHLNWASDKALELFDAGDADKALLLWGMLLGKNPDNAWIVTTDFTPFILMDGVARGHRELELAMKGFAASDSVSA